MMSTQSASTPEAGANRADTTLPVGVKTVRVIEGGRVNRPASMHSATNSNLDCPCLK